MWSTNDLESIEELKNKLLTANLELESAKSLLLQERTKNHESVKHLLNLLRSAWQERDEAQKQRDEARNELQSLLSKILAPKPTTPSRYDHHDNHHDNHLSDFTNFEESDNDTFYNIAPAEDHNHNRCGFSSSSSSPLSSPSPCSSSVAILDRLVVEGKKALPEKGRLLQAVVEAGPLLQTLLVAPIPQWKNPPPMPPTLPLPTTSFPISPFSSPAAEAGAGARAGAEILDHVPQMPPLSSSSCLDITKQMIDSGSRVVKYQMGNGELGMLSDHVVSGFKSSVQF